MGAGRPGFRRRPEGKGSWLWSISSIILGRGGLASGRPSEAARTGIRPTLRRSPGIPCPALRPHTREHARDRAASAPGSPKRFVARRRPSPTSPPPTARPHSRHPAHPAHARGPPGERGGSNAPPEPVGNPKYDLAKIDVLAAPNHSARVRGGISSIDLYLAETWPPGLSLGLAEMWHLPRCGISRNVALAEMWH